MDKKSLTSGVFDQAIVSQIESCIDFLLIVTQTTFDRCGEQNDWILNEVHIALQYRKNIIPVFVGIDRFPTNVPKSLNELCRYNGIIWEGENSIQKIETFLKSNRRYILWMESDGKTPVLTKESREQLKYLLQRFNKYGRLPVDVDLHIADIDQIAENVVRSDIINDSGIEFAKVYATQSILQSFKWYKKSLLYAIEFLLQDPMLDSVGMKLRSFYIDKYGINNCYYVDSEGAQHFYWTAFLWIDVIEEMLKEITLESGRDYYYGNTRDKYCQVDLFIRNRRGEEIWSFTSYITINPEDEKYRKLAELFKSYSWGDFFDIPVLDIAFLIYPDLYLEIGSMKANSDNSMYQQLAKIKGIFNLMYYYIGIH